MTKINKKSAGLGSELHAYKSENIEIRGAREHNLKNVDLDIPIGSLSVITGLSGSGKSSLAFDTLYAEGQRRYVESLSAYARQFLGIMNKPDVDKISGLSPAISIEQKSTSRNPRSTVGTVTEIYDYLRLLFARVGQPHCPKCGQPITSQEPQTIVKDILLQAGPNKVAVITSVLARQKKGAFDTLFKNLFKLGYSKVIVDKKDYELPAEIVLDKNYKHDIEVIVDRVTVSEENRSRIFSSVETAIGLSEDGMLLVRIADTKTKQETQKFYNTILSCSTCQINFEKIEPRMFSFNSPFGACQECHGLGAHEEFVVDLIVPDEDACLYDGALKPWDKQMDGWRGQQLEALAHHFKFDLYTPWKKLPQKVKDIILHGTDEKVDFTFKAKSSNAEYKWEGQYDGIVNILHKQYMEAKTENKREDLQKFMRSTPCPACKGLRLRPEVLAILVDTYNIAQITDLSVKELFEFVDHLTFTEEQKIISTPIIKEVKARLSFLINVGLEYLTLSRSAATLSGGEAQRIRLATQIGSELRGVLYILDEPSIGLHQRDNEKLLNTLKYLRDIGNTLLVVEHDEDTIRAADYVVDVGPGAGVHGGKIVASGTINDVIKVKESLTGQYLSGKRKIEVPKKRREWREYLELVGCKENNLKNIDVKFPLHVMTCVTGVSGSGKSTLVNDTLALGLAQRLYRSKELPGVHKELRNYGLIDKIVNIDQSPIGRTPRSNPATYTGLFTPIRDLFSESADAKMRGYQPGRFSFNVKGGRCETCAGDGQIKIEMHFLPDVYVTCEKCQGTRYNSETLEVHFKGKNIAQVLAMSVEEAYNFFVDIPLIAEKLQLLKNVGLDYITLGQPATQLSGGEAQRIKLALELSKRPTGKTIYILDEPTTGLHFEDVRKLLEVLHQLADKGNTVVVIEHNLDVIKTADWIIDIGPEGGDGGGQIVAQGTPEQIVKVRESHTGRFLSPML
ncbi:excinuclease ABC subunit UvrA [Candidatus Falkowbacteria bacterium]|nr:excinuclease ABC subunit UvrA [Candidatus Falkowbacteria bacterium]